MKAVGKIRIAYPSRSNVISIWNLGDWHWLSRACAENRLKRDIQRIKDDPMSFFIGTGDYFDWVWRKDRRFNPQDFPPWVPITALANPGEFIREEFKSLITPILPKCLGLLMGNHEFTWELYHDHQGDFEKLCNDLGVPYLGYSGFIDLCFDRTPDMENPLKTPYVKDRKIRSGMNRRTIRAFGHHGAGAAMTDGAKMNTFVRIMSMVDARIIFVGHLHFKTVHEAVYIGADRSCLIVNESRVKAGCCTGGYRKVYAQDVTTYSEPKAWKPAALGMTRVLITPDKDIVET